MSVTTWDAEVAAGKWPKGEPRGAKGGKLTWDVEKLKALSDVRAGLAKEHFDDYEMARAAAAARRQRDAEAKGRR